MWAEIRKGASTVEKGRKRLLALLLAGALGVQSLGVAFAAVGDGAPFWVEQMNDGEEGVYEAILAAQQSRNATGQVDIPLTGGVKFDTAVGWVEASEQYIYGQRPEIFWFATTGSASSLYGYGNELAGINYQPQTTRKYTDGRAATGQNPHPLDWSLIDGRNSQLQEAVAGILITGESKAEKVRAINRWLVEHVQYDVTLEGLAIYEMTGALVDGVAVCDGYAKAFKYLCDREGITCLYVPGDGISQVGEPAIAHAWNYVQLEENGPWYLVDSTWNDPVVHGGTLADLPAGTDERYLLVGGESVVDGMKVSLSHRPYPAENAADPQRSSGFLMPVLSGSDYSW